jgi:hypothetical protein
MNKSLTAISVIAILVLSLTTLGLAAEDSATVTVGWTINAQQSLSVSSNNLSSASSASKGVESVFNIPEPSKGDIKRGFIKKENAVELVARSNVAWEVQVKTEDQYLGTSDNGNYKKPSSDLSIRGQGSFKPVSTSPTTIAEGQPGEFKFGVDYKVQYDENYEEGDYQARLVYTITTA